MNIVLGFHPEHQRFAEQVRPLIESVRSLGLTGILLHTGEVANLSGIQLIRTDKTTAFDAYAEYLASSKAESVWCVEPTQVGIFSDPFVLLASLPPDAVYAVREWEPIKKVPEWWQRGVQTMPDDYLSFMQEYGDLRACVPECFGGSVPVVRKLVDDVLAELNRCRSFFPSSRPLPGHALKFALQRIINDGRSAGAVASSADYRGVELLAPKSPFLHDRNCSLHRLAYVRDSLSPVLRDNGEDAGVWNSVYTGNEYGLPKDMTGLVVIDIGANIGAFSAACLDRGAEFVIAVEPDPDNMQQAALNLAKYGGRVALVQAAVWRSDRNESLSLNGTGPHVISMPGSGKIPTTSLDRLIDMAGGRVDWVKMDCEGAEAAIVYTSKKLDRISHLVGEWHGNHWKKLQQVSPSPTEPYCIGGFMAILHAAGLQVSHTEPEPNIGHFNARRLIER